MEIRETLNFDGFDFEQRVLLQAFAIKPSKSKGERGEEPCPDVVILSQNKEQDDGLIIAYILDEGKMNRLFFEIRNKKIVLLNAFQMLSALDFKPPENYDCLRCALFVLENYYYKHWPRYKRAFHLPPCLGRGTDIASTDYDLLQVYMSQTKEYLKILADVEKSKECNVFNGIFYKHVRAASEYALEHNRQLPEYFQHPFISATGYLSCLDFNDKTFERLTKHDPHTRYFRLDVGEFNWIFYCVLIKQDEKIKEQPTSEELQRFYTDYSDVARHARYLGLQTYYEIIFNLVIASFVPFIIDRQNFIFALKTKKMTEVFNERAMTIAYSRIKNIASSVANKRLGKLNEEAKQ